MKRLLSTIACLALLLSVLPAETAGAATVKPGESITIHVPFSSTEPIVAMQASYTVSSGLEFISGSCAGMTGKASASKAVFISLGGVTEGTLTLQLNVRAEAEGEQQVKIHSLKGGSSGSGSAALLQTDQTYTYNISEPLHPTAVPTADVAAIRTPAPTMMPIIDSTLEPSAGSSTAGTPMSIAQSTGLQATEKLIPLGESENVMPNMSAPQVVLTADDTMFSAPEDFSILKASGSNVPRYFTGIKLPGFDDTVYAFTDKAGVTQYRLYGRLNKKKGMYEAKLTTEISGDIITITLSVTGTEPARDRLADRAEAKSVALDDTTLPDGYHMTTKRGVMYFTNLFNRKEYRVLGAYEGLDNAFYPAVNGRPKIASLAIDLRGDKDQMPGSDGEFFKIPKAYKDGIANLVFIQTSDGQRLSVWTDKPILDKALLK